MDLRVLTVCAICCFSSQVIGVRFPNEDAPENTKSGIKAEERYSDSQASSVIMQPNGVKQRLPHFIMPQAPSGQNPFGHVNPGGYAEGIILNQPSGRPPPNRHFKPNTKSPEKMKQVQRVPYRVMTKSPTNQVQTRKPLFVPKGPPPPKDMRNHPDAMKHKLKHPHLIKEQEYHSIHKPDSLGFSEKEMLKLKGHKYFMKGPHTPMEHPYQFIPTPPPQDIHQNFEKFYNDKIHTNNIVNAHHAKFPSYQPQGEFPQYYQHENFQGQENQQHIFNKPYVPVQEHIEEPAFLKKDTYPLQHQGPHFDHIKQATPTVESLVDYINKWSSTKKYETKYTPFKEWGELEEPNFEKAWLSASEWVPIHAPAPPLGTLQVYPNLDNTYSSNNFAIYPENLGVTTPSFTHRQSFAQQYAGQSFTNALTQPANTLARPQHEHTINPYDLASPIFQKPEVVIGKRPKSADVNNSHEVSAVFMVKQ